MATKPGFDDGILTVILKGGKFVLGVKDESGGGFETGMFGAPVLAMKEGDPERTVSFTLENVGGFEGSVKVTVVARNEPTFMTIHGLSNPWATELREGDDIFGFDLGSSFSVSFSVPRKIKIPHGKDWYQWDGFLQLEAKDDEKKWYHQTVTLLLKVIPPS